MIATFRLRAGSNALSTTPIPPRPSTPLTSYVPSRPSESGQSDGAEEVERFHGRSDSAPCESGRVGPEVAADRLEPAVAADQSVEQLAALCAVLQVLFEPDDLGGRQAILGQQPQAVGITGVQAGYS